MHKDQSRCGPLLRRWRELRHLTQLDLALDAGISARHVSFLETGKTVPSREMLLVLSQVLDIPLRERNPLLLAAGYAPLYEETPLDDARMAEARAALQCPPSAVRCTGVATCDRELGGGGEGHARLGAARRVLDPRPGHARPDCRAARLSRRAGRLAQARSDRAASTAAALRVDRPRRGAQCAHVQHHHLALRPVGHHPPGSAYRGLLSGRRRDRSADLLRGLRTAGYTPGTATKE